MTIGWIPERDADGAILQRVKQASQGFTYQARAMEIETSVLSSLVNIHEDGSSWGDGTLKFYDSSDVELTTQANIDLYCVKTVLQWNPTYSYDLIGGFLEQISTPLVDIRLWAIGAPGIADKVMINGVNLRYLTSGDRLLIDGRTSKYMQYIGAAPNANAMQMVFKHPTAYKMKIMVVWEHFKA